jgi:hypothetical protein
MPIEKGKSYTWPEIVAELHAEGTKPLYALHRNRKVVGFALNRRQNPKAPDEILAGYGESREQYADAFIRDQPVVPVFIREAETEELWRCAGNFRLRGSTEENSEKNKRVMPFDIPAIYKILFLEEVQG